jgi:putative toxin-antitoxin system antitoxin component (TIGR02293 family)
MSTSAGTRVSADIAELWSRVQSGRREGHYYAALFGLRRYDTLHLIEQIRRGLTYAAFERFQRNTALSYGELARFVEIPERTLARRRESGRLEPDESDRLVRTSRVFARAIELFEGNAESARRWLTTPLRALGDNSPLEFANTDVGAGEVENLIGRLEHGLPT